MILFVLKYIISYHNQKIKICNQEKNPDFDIS